MNLLYNHTYKLFSDFWIETMKYNSFCHNFYVRLIISLELWTLIDTCICYTIRFFYDVVMDIINSMKSLRLVNQTRTIALKSFCLHVANLSWPSSKIKQCTCMLLENGADHVFAFISWMKISVYFFFYIYFQ